MGNGTDQGIDLGAMVKLPIDLNMRMLDLASFFLGVKEKGQNQGSIIETFQRAVDGVAQGEAWCLNMLQYIALETSKVHSYQIDLPKTEGVIRFWNAISDRNKMITPKPGHWVLWDMGNGKGHCGIIRQIISTNMITIEGNTASEKEEGVFMKSRSLANKKVLGFIKVFHTN
mgnify:CR=1 FL=1